ncbi:MAG: CoA transferase [Dehalococcoidia bacterium]
MVDLPLRGVRVLDFGQVIAVPFCTQWMAWMGADVVLVESRRHLTSRTFPPFLSPDNDIDTSGSFNLINQNKRSCVIDVTTAEGKTIIRDLVRISDVLVDNLGTGVLERFGFGPQAVWQLRPDLIVLSLGAFGRAGPLKDQIGFHSAVNLFSGVADVTGYEAGHPRMIGGVFPDSFSGAHTLYALLTALHHRRRTGKGQYIDVAMYEPMLSLIPEAIIDYTLNGREPVRIGNHDPYKVPHNIYRCRGDDAWLAISVSDDREFARLAVAAGHPDWADDPRFATALARRTHERELDALLDAWSRGFTPYEAMERLQRAGVKAGAVMQSHELSTDPQLRYRGMPQETDHPKVGRRGNPGVPWVTDTQPPVTYRPPPLFGQHTREVLTTLVGLDDAEFRRLEAARVFN